MGVRRDTLFAEDISPKRIADTGLIPQRLFAHAPTWPEDTRLMHLLKRNHAARMTPLPGCSVGIFLYNGIMLTRHLPCIQDSDRLRDNNPYIRRRNMTS